MRLQMDFRPLLGLGPEDRGTLIERVLTRVVLEMAVAAHNRDVAEAKSGS